MRLKTTSSRVKPDDRHLFRQGPAVIAAVNFSNRLVISHAKLGSVLQKAPRKLKFHTWQTGQHSFQRQHLPVFRNITEPVDAGGFHRSVGVQALRDGAGNEGLALFGQPFQKRTLLLDEPVDPRSLLIQKPHNPPLRVEWGKRDEGPFFSQVLLTEPVAS